ncbi:MAG: hypothetical protein FWC79_06515 [Oscillospiraceae bacterium]|nr:hypothetical protein [Oscillospiraceae bacterium]
MKFSQKIFIMTFILIIVSMNLIGFLVIRNNHRINIDAEISRGIAGVNSISDSLYLFNSIESISILASRTFKE